MSTTLHFWVGFVTGGFALIVVSLGVALLLARWLRSGQSEDEE